MDQPQRGSWNMAIDQALLESSAQSNELTLRIYGWQPATISLGYFQPIEQRKQHLPSLACPIVRRSTGGGAIVHDNELTYSLVIPTAVFGRRHHREITKLVHESLIGALNQFNDENCRIVEDTENHPRNATFLCFRRRSEGDVLLENNKIIGSAQRRVKGSLLQHGSVLIQRSDFAPELPGINDLSHVNLNPSEFAECWSSILADYLGKTVKNAAYKIGERMRAEQIDKERFGSIIWTEKR